MVLTIHLSIFIKIKFNYCIYSLLKFFKNALFDDSFFNLIKKKKQGLLLQSKIVVNK